MPRITGALNYTSEQVNFIKANWRFMSDETMSGIVNMPISSVQRCRTRYGLTRYLYSVSDNSTIAFVCELFVSGHKIKDIKGIVGKSHSTICGILTKNLFGTPHGENTEVRTFQSKINEDEQV